MDTPRENMQVERGPTDTLRGLKDWADIGAKTALGTLTASYVMGLLVVNFHLQQYGLTQFGLLHVEYVITGLVWLFLVAFGGLTAKRVWHLTAAQVADRTHPWLARRAMAYFLSMPCLFFVALSFLTDGTLSPFHWQGYLVGAGLALQGRFAMDTWTSLRRVGSRFRDGSILTEKDHSTMYRALFDVVGFFFLVPVYAVVLYPLLSPAFGGAKELDVSMVIKAEQVPVIRALGFSVTDERVTAPVKLIIETPEFLLVRPPVQKNRARELKAVRIRRDLVDAVLYVGPRR
jgi:hypothetical protein